MKKVGFKISSHLVIALVIIILGVFARVYKMSFIMMYDEAATYLHYCDEGIKNLLTFRTLNNHLLHTVIVKIFIEFFGDHPFIIRVPSFLFGLLNIFLVYHLSRLFFNKFTALVSILLYSSFPVAIHFESIARGYSPKITFSLLLFLSCYKFVNNPSRKRLLIVSIVSSLGFLTIFSFILPFLGTLLWVVIQIYNRKILSSNVIADFLIPTAIYTTIFSLFFYAPSIILSMDYFVYIINAVATGGKSYGKFPGDIPIMIKEIFNLFFFNNTFTGILVLSASTYLIIKKNELAFLVLSHLTASIALVITFQTMIPARSFVFLVPFILILTSKGIDIFFNKFQKHIVLAIPLVQLIFYLNIYKNNYFSIYHSNSSDLLSVVKYMNEVPMESKVFIIEDTAFYMTFKFYHRLNNLPVIEAIPYEEIKENQKNLYLIAYNTSSKSFVRFSKAFENDTFSVYRSNSHFN